MTDTADGDAPEAKLRHCVLAHTRVRPGLADDLVQLFAPLIAAARKEPGCARYELWQDAVNPRHFVVVQEWETEEALEAHVTSPLVKTIGYRLGDLVEGPPRVVRFVRAL